MHWMRVRLVLAVIDVLSLTACKGCKKDNGEGENTNLDDVSVVRTKSADMSAPSFGQGAGGL